MSTRNSDAARLNRRLAVHRCLLEHHLVRESEVDWPRLCKTVDQLCGELGGKNAATLFREIAANIEERPADEIRPYYEL